MVDDEQRIDRWTGEQLVEHARVEGRCGRPGGPPAGMTKQVFETGFDVEVVQAFRRSSAALVDAPGSHHCPEIALATEVSSDHSCAVSSTAAVAPVRRTWRVLVGAVAFVGAGDLTACSNDADCAEASCPLPVVVELSPEAIPADAAPRLCVADVCSELSVEPYANAFGWPDSWSGDKAVDVRIEFVDAGSVTVRAFAGRGTLSGDCCKFLRLRLARDGNSLAEAP